MAEHKNSSRTGEGVYEGTGKSNLNTHMAR